jgi:SAM-dependent methyltransferase
MGLFEDAARNRDVWTKSNADYTDHNALASWNAEPAWGIWKAPEAEVRVLGDVAGLDVVELGCGTAYVSAWLVRAGARPVAVDITPAQLETARRCMAETGIEFPLVEADAGETGLPGASADLVVSEYGASIWVDPYRWIPEAARLLRPGGRLVFLCNSTLVILCSPDGDEPAVQSLQRPQRGMHRFDDWDGVEFHLPHGEWIELLRTNGFEVERLVELYASEDAVDHPYYDFVSADWARRWPVEEIWVARKAPLVGADVRSAGSAGAPSALPTSNDGDA